MSSFSEMPSLVYTSYVVIQLICAILSSSFLYPVLRNKMGKLYQAFVSVVLVIAYTTLFVFTLGGEYHHEGHNDMKISEFVFETPAIYMIAIEIVEIAVLIFMIIKIHKFTKTSVPPKAIAQGYNSINNGICIYQDHGLPRMVNKYMERLSFAITGNYLYDGNEFIENLRNPKKGEKLEENGDRIIIKLDNKYYSFEFNEFYLGQIHYRRIKASDITLEYSLLNNLSEENERRINYQERLRRYSEDLESITIDEEILKTKMDIHNDYGQILLVGKYSVEHSERRDEFLDRWNKISNLIFEEKNDDFAEFNSMADSLGINVKINGRIKADHQKIVIKLLYEVLTNTVKHTNSNNIILDVKELAEDVTKYSVHNDAINDSPDFKEGGGLSSFRKLAEKNGAEVTYDLRPYFTIELEFGKRL
ncbi:MAG: hypothetical protein K6A63_03835 [Acholeplasmatales bacterium]|nr:hypothetical protein [Acholeplasmatales bacterium]